MRVCFVVGGMNLGGVQTFILNLARYMIDQGDEVTVLVIRQKGVWWDQLESNGIEGVSILREDYVSPLTQAIAIGKFLKQRRFDLIFLNHAREAQLALPLVPPESIAIPIIHNDTQGAISLAIRNFRFADAIVTVSPSLKGKAAQLVSDIPIYQLNYPVLMPDDEALLSRTPWCQNLKMIYVGRILEQQKGIMILPAILQQCRAEGLDVTLDIVGDGPDFDLLKHQLEASDTADRAFIHGSLPPNEIGDMLLSRHVLLMPSHYEGLGIVAVEAQAAGCVPIATRLPGVTDHSIKEGVTGFLARPHSTGDYVNHLHELSADGDLWNRMSRHGRSHVVSLFGIPQASSEFRLCYEKSRGSQARSSILRNLAGFLAGTNWRDQVPNFLRRETRV